MSTATAGANVIELFAAAADRRGDAPAILSAEGRVLWSFEALADVASRLAGGLARAGVGPGDRVLVLDRDPRRRFAVVAGTLWAGATVVAPPASLPGLAALSAALVARPTAVAFEPRLWPAVLGLAGLRTIPVRIVASGPPLMATSLADLARAPAVAPCEVAGHLPALASFTTGSSGPPKLVLRSHDVLRAQHDALGRLRSLSEDDRDLVGLPFLALHDLAAGVTCVLPPADVGSSRFATRVRDTLAGARVTSAAGFPQLFRALVDGGRLPKRRDLRAVHLGGSRVPLRLVESLTRVLRRCEVTVVYGSTEAEPIAAISGGDYLAALDADADDGVCAGRVVPGVDVRIVAPDRPEGSHGRIGAIQLRGRRVIGPPGSDGWIDTGDAGRLGDDGRLWLLGRTEHAVAGLYPFQAERLVETLDWVERAALVRGGPDRRERGLMVVEPRRWDPPAVPARTASVHHLVLERRWPIDEVRVLRRLPAIPGPAAKVDTVRLTRSATRPRWA